MTEAEQAYQEIFMKIIPEAIEQFRDKTQDYRGGSAFLFLGSRGQFSDINRKFWKLYAAIWQGQKLEGEQPEEIVQDFIGHCFLLLYCLQRESLPFETFSPDKMFDARGPEPRQDRCPSCGTIAFWAGRPDSAHCEDPWHGGV